MTTAEWMIDFDDGNKWWTLTGIFLFDNDEVDVEVEPNIAGMPFFFFIFF